MTMESMQEIVDRLQPLKKELQDIERGRMKWRWTALPKAVLDEIDGKEWLPVSFVVFDKDEGPCDPYNNGDHSDCDEDECYMEVYPL